MQSSVQTICMASIKGAGGTEQRERCQLLCCSASTRKQGPGGCTQGLADSLLLGASMANMKGCGALGVGVWNTGKGNTALQHSQPNNSTVKRR